MFACDRIARISGRHILAHILDITPEIHARVEIL
jgi:hypothetical protein